MSENTSYNKSNAAHSETSSGWKPARKNDSARSGRKEYTRSSAERSSSQFRSEDRYATQSESGKTGRSQRNGHRSRSRNGQSGTERENWRESRNGQERAEYRGKRRHGSGGDYITSGKKRYWSSEDEARGGVQSSNPGYGKEKHRGEYLASDNRNNRRDRSDKARGERLHDRDRERSYGRGGERRSSFNNERGGQRNHPEPNLQRQRRTEAQRLQAEIPVSITPDSLDTAIRSRLRSLNKENAEIVARHLAYAGEMLDIDPEVAYVHAKAAFQRAARIDVVREALGITAYVTGRYSEALSELRTYRRMSDDYSHIPLEADAERGLGRSEKALQFISGIPLNRLAPAAKVELALVASGARADIGESEAGLSVLEKIRVEMLDTELAARVQLVKAERLTELGRTSEAEQLRAEWEAKLDSVQFSGDVLLDLDDMLDDIDVASLQKADQATQTSVSSEDIVPRTETISSSVDSAEVISPSADELENADIVTKQTMLDTKENVQENSELAQALAEIDDIEAELLASLETDPDFTDADE